MDIILVTFHSFFTLQLLEFSLLETGIGPLSWEGFENSCCSGVMADLLFLPCCLLFKALQVT